MNKTEFTLQPHMHIHIIGIGGAGMSAIARVLLGRGYTVSGSDAKAGEMTAALQTAGAAVFIGHDAAHLAGADVVVISSAIPAENPELAAAQEQQLPVLKRDTLLGSLMTDTIGIAVAGSHGKTTTTGMIAQILMGGELDPTVIVGGVLPTLDGNGRFGEGDYFVVEADEYDHMFLGLKPEVAVITNIEHDHPDLFPTDDAYEQAFRQFAELLPPGGRLILCYDDPGVRRIAQQLKLKDVQITTYGIAAEGNGDEDEKGETAVAAADIDFQALDVRDNNLGGADFLVETEGQVVGLARLRVPGRHNVLNALAAIIVGLDVGLDFIVIQRALAEFGGVGRRFQVIGEVGNVTVIDDYAHHPTEIRATLAAARQRYSGRRLWAIWQPHTYSRTKLLLEQFATCFDEADRVVALDIYPSRETDTLGISTEMVLAGMAHPKAVHVSQRKDAAAYVLDRIRPGDLVLTLGAGDGNVVGHWILEGLEERLQRA